MFSAIVERRFDSLAALKERRSALDAAEAAWLADVAEYHHSGDWNTEHYLNAASAIADACRIDTGVAHTYVTMARKLEKLPAVADAYAAGDISGRHAAVIAGAHTRAHADQLSCIDNRLAELAKELKPSELGAVVRRYTDAIDGDGGAKSEEEQFARRRYHASRGLENMLRVDGLYECGERPGPPGAGSDRN